MVADGAGLFKQLANGAKVQPEGDALSFGDRLRPDCARDHLCVMWPYTKVLHANIYDGGTSTG